METANSISINEYLQQCRIEQKISIRKLSEESKVSASHISRIERGKRFPSPKVLKQLSVPLNVDYLTLMEIAHIYKPTTIDLKSALLKNSCCYNGRPLALSLCNKILELLP